MKSLGGHLGRTARMLACQALSRFSEITSMNALSRIHWRSMLQVSELVLISCKSCYDYTVISIGSGSCSVLFSVSLNHNLK